MHIEEFEAWSAAYDHFNAALFQGRLPAVVFEYTNRKTVRGFAAPDRYADKDGAASHVVAMNSTLFIDRPLRDTLSTLVHEMTHIEQFEEGTGTRPGYHNRRWGELMKRVGLHPSHDGKPGGRETGQRVTHYVIPGGPFDVAADDLLSTGWIIRFAQRTGAADKAAPKGRTAFSCSACLAKAWAQDPQRVLYCGCTPVPMLMHAAVASL
jgi:predicted SprT family Zn-dependent metalloprotease